jgi:TRAP-type C4-dicarboxylate transport system permease large subunit
MAAFVFALSSNPVVVLLLLNIFLFVVGMFMDAVPAVMILVPVLLPIVKVMGYDPVHFGMLMCFNLTIGLIHPPIGTVLYTTAMATGVKIDILVKSIWPWVGVCVAVLLLVAYVPDSVMFLPRLFSK